MGHIKFVSMLIRGGEYKDFEESYLKAKEEGKETFNHNEHEFKVDYGKSVCDLVMRTLNK
tara:strand:+ start:89 stop:268 length:180 start_codon:yes stop_codon:yes gene_type:complete